ncbi:hypothetical protein BD309DRAFT_361091 [Dichomitus squalens]|uniref:Uncharacterized protein n=1 Tax=Dichomitus squalens TaxID=114155 RepID=A0A4Q9QA57_9APHY|nr:hypothetical protein BD309DRAFT_361091 [Dichomitus squalens]TBU64435.1 hypothetical protein BD310DRAFT_397549 [Dichomitus squalens]
MCVCLPPGGTCISMCVGAHTLGSWRSSRTQRPGSRRPAKGVSKPARTRTREWDCVHGTTDGQPSVRLGEEHAPRAVGSHSGQLPPGAGRDCACAGSLDSDRVAALDRPGSHVILRLAGADERVRRSTSTSAHLPLSDASRSSPRRCSCSWGQTSTARTHSTPRASRTGLGKWMHFCDALRLIKTVCIIHFRLIFWCAMAKHA